MNNPGVTEVLFSLILVVISIAISRFWKIDVEKDSSHDMEDRFEVLIKDLPKEVVMIRFTNSY